MGVMLDFMFGRDHRSLRSLQVTLANLLGGVGLRWFRGDDGGACGLGQARNLGQARDCPKAKNANCALCRATCLPAASQRG